MKTNYLAILVCAVVNAVLGMAWFGVFQKEWMAGHGLVEGDVNQSDPMPIVVSILVALTVALIISMIWRKMGVCTWREGAQWGIALGLIGLLGTIVGNLYAQKPFELSLIDGGYAFLQMAIFGTILGGWVKKAPAEA